MTDLAAQRVVYARSLDEALREVTGVLRDRPFLRRILSEEVLEEDERMKLDTLLS